MPLHELRNEGLINLYGASNWSLPRFKESFTYSQDSGKQPFTVLSNNFSLARMNDPVWPGCESCSEDPYKRILKGHASSNFSLVQPSKRFLSGLSRI